MYKPVFLRFPVTIRTGDKNSQQEAIESWNIRAGGWINVKDKLPEENVEILAYTSNNIIVQADYVKHTDQWFSKPKPAGRIGEVTHWQSLPEQPEENKND